MMHPYRLDGNWRVLVPRLLLLLALFSYYVFLGVNLPTSESPDELMRILVPNYIVEHGALPLGYDPEIMNATWGTSYGFSTYGSSLIAVPFMLVARILFASPVAVLIAARVSTAVLAVGTLVVCFRLGDELKLPNHLSMLYVVLIALLPQFAFLASYFNSDMLEFFATALTMLCLVQGVHRRWDIASCVKLGVALGIVALSNYYAYGAILASIVCFYVSMFTLVRSGRASGRKSALYLGKPLIVFLSAWVVAGWFFVRNMMLYDGDFFGMNTSSATSELCAALEFRPSQRATPLAVGLSPLQMLAGGYNGLDWITSTLQSSIGVLGYLKFPLGERTFMYYYIILGVGFIGGVAACWRRTRGMRLAASLTTAIMLFTPIILSIYYSWSSDYQAQGRYIMAPVCLFMLFVAVGWYALLRRCAYGLSGVMPRVRKAGNTTDEDDKLVIVRRLCLAATVVLVCSYVFVYVHVFCTVVAPHLLTGITVGELQGTLF